MNAKSTSISSNSYWIDGNELIKVFIVSALINIKFSNHTSQHVSTKEQNIFIWVRLANTPWVILHIVMG